MLSRLNTVIAIPILSIFINSCNGQAQQIENCKSNFKKARTNFNAYYKSKNPSLLREALGNVEQATKCEETRQGGVELKLSLLMLLKQYEDGYKYVDSLNESEFKASYKKKMWYKCFLALDYDSKSDTTNRNKNYDEIIKAIVDYIQLENAQKKKFDEEAYYDLFFIKAKTADQKLVSAEINKFEEQYPSEKDFFDGIKTTLLNIPAQANVAPNN